MKKLLSIIVVGFLISTHSVKAKDLDWTGKRAIKYVETMCLALGVKPDNIKNSPSSKCRNKFSAIAFEYE